jgi:ABC-type sugar transport system ATPase subunit
MDLLEAREITKYFRDTRTLADDRVSLSLAEGEIRAVVGENGAGKSTFARIIAGLVAQDSGEIRVRGQPLRPGSVRESEAAGIGFVPQQSLLAEDLTVAENMVLGREPRSMGLFLSRRKAYVETAMLVERFGIRLDPEALVSSLSAAERRLADIAKALARGGEILVLDEPTSILSDSESERLFDLLEGLAKAGKAILLITHRLSEVVRMADTICVLRDGVVVADMRADEADEAVLSRLMARDTGRRFAMGRPVGIAKEAGPSLSSGSRKRPGTPALDIKDVVLARGAKALSMSVFSGEILAVVALAGNGLGRLEDFASGMEKPKNGEVFVAGLALTSIPRYRLRSEIMGYIPSDREKRGLCLPVSTRDNLLALRGREFKARDWIGQKHRNEAAREAAIPLGLAADPRQSVASLSGGNRQRLLLARELDRPREVLVLAEALQSLDIASQAEARIRIRNLAARGSAVLFLTSNIEDLLGLADRAIALYRGEIAYEGPNEGPSTAARLLEAMTGAGLAIGAAQGNAHEPIA